MTNSISSPEYFQLDILLAGLFAVETEECVLISLIYKNGIKEIYNVSIVMVSFKKWQSVNPLSAHLFRVFFAT